MSDHSPALPPIHQMRRGLGRSSQAISYMLGSGLIVLAIASIWTATPARSILEWARDIFGISFSLFFGMLVFLSIFAILQMRGQDARAETWRETGMHAASGIATLALTYTLLGISLGIGSLANHDLNPDTINDVIRELTAHFSLAFMTTVVGLPVSALLRAAVGIAWSRQALHSKDNAADTANEESESTQILVPAETQTAPDIAPDEGEKPCAS